MKRKPRSSSAATPSPEGVATSMAGSWRRGCTAFAMLLSFVLLPGALEGQRRQDLPNAIEAERAIAQLRSPYCPGFMLEVCTSSQAAALRDSIFVLAAEGMTSDEIVEWMIGNHGEEWRAVPGRSGAGLWAWIVPPLALLLGMGLVLGWIRAHRREEPEEQGAPTRSVSDGDRARLVAAMREMEESGEEVV